MKKIKPIYLDYAATTPIDPQVVRAMAPYFSERFGNPGSLHSFGQEAITAIDQSRETMARLLECNFREVIFAGSATEANNLVLRGVMKRASDHLKEEQPHLVVSVIEHESVLETARELEREGFAVTYLPVDSEGRVRVADLKACLTPRTVFVSIMYGNNEVGSVQSIQKLAEVVREARGEKGAFPLFHTDAVQAFQYCDSRPAELGVDFMTISGHKIYGPKGVAALYIKESARGFITPIITGGGQEFGLRSGTENVLAVVGLTRAAELALAMQKKERARLLLVRQEFLSRLRKVWPKIQVNGPKGKEGLPHILNISFPGQNASEFLTRLDLLGIAVSSGSACTARSPQLSHVLLALGHSPERARSAVRFSFGRGTKQADMQRVIKLLEGIRR